MKHMLFIGVGSFFSGVVLSSAIALFFSARGAELQPECVPSPPTDLSETEYLKQYLEGVREFGLLRIGGKAPNGAGEIAPFDGKVIPKSEFYIYVHRRGLSLCEFDGCGIAEGKVVACMGGWLSGDGHPEVSDLVGLDSMEVAQGKASIVVISDEHSRIMGIYPYHSEGDILPILAQFPVHETSLLDCAEKELASRRSSRAKSR